MNNTNYLPPVAPSRTYSDYLGGLRKFWIAPREWLNGFPDVDPTTQVLAAEPTLLAGRDWMGPIDVSSEMMGYEEVSTPSPAGVFYKRKFSFLETGLAVSNHINIGNLMGYEFCVVGLVRSGAYFIVCGNDRAGMKLDTNEGTGIGPLGMPMTKLALTDERAEKAIVLPSFSH